jgi:hypothetical protein
MWRDPIVEEVRHNRLVYAARFHHDINAICRAAREQQQKSRHKIVSLPPRFVTTTMKVDSLTR